MTGRVWLIGAGPGDPELLTLQAARILAAADVIVHDRLVGPGVLGLCRTDATFIDVSKRPREPSIEQDEINRILVSAASTGAGVARVKGGDPFVFGRGGEEALALAHAGIPFEIIPGMSSALSAPAAAGIPVTHRGISRSFAVVTAHAQALDEHDWRALAVIDTLVVLMGAVTAAEIARRLIAAGRSGETHAAAIQDATLPGQREVRSTLATLPQTIADGGLRAPLVLVIGAVADLDVRHVTTTTVHA